MIEYFIFLFFKSVLTYIVYFYVIIHQVSSYKELAREVEKTSAHDANVADANVQPKQNRKLSKKRKSKSPRRTYVRQKVYFKFIFVNLIIYD